ncbi:hypothetical protein GCM10009549_50920 [Streptomyces thermoalcalitolerans]|uniref:Secreted protein n=1 Tax=Streptomyces thermoalcalitolerans TaxID=65605 RepID=A0ABP4A1P7_9ACTN
MPTSPTGEAADSFRAGVVLFLFFRLVHIMLAHAREDGQRPVEREGGITDRAGGRHPRIHVTSTL